MRWKPQLFQTFIFFFNLLILKNKMYYLYKQKKLYFSFAYKIFGLLTFCYAAPVILEGLTNLTKCCSDLLL